MPSIVVFNNRNNERAEHILLYHIFIVEVSVPFDWEKHVKYADLTIKMAYLSASPLFLVGFADHDNTRTHH